MLGGQTGQKKLILMAVLTLLSLLKRNVARELIVNMALLDAVRGEGL